MDLPVIVVSILLAAVLALIVTVIARAAAFKSKQLPVREKISYAIEADAAARRLAEAIRFKTVSNADKSKVDFSTFRAFHEFLQKSYPLVHAKLEKQLINEQNLLYTWKGIDADKKPVLLMAHQDVVPAFDQNWKHPPFSGAIEDGYIWGRGTLDDKGSVLAILEAAEFLLQSGYQPSRSICLAFGIDEEVGGHEGAHKIAEYLKLKGMQFEFILDEGQVAVKGAVAGIPGWIALIGIAEKGYISLELSAEQIGGHSAAPPPQTSVGILANAVARVQNNLFPLRLTRAASGLFEYLGPEMRGAMKMIYANTWLFGNMIKNTMAKTPSAASLRTTTAPTMFSGSPQDNVLPMKATAVINFRILQGDSIKSVTDRVTRLVGDPRVKITPLGQDNTEPSPVSPVDNEPYKIIDRTIREVMGDILVIPTLVQGKTDSIHYRGLSENCYRFIPARVPAVELGSLHGFNERISVSNYVEMIEFYIRLLQNAC